MRTLLVYHVIGTFDCCRAAKIHLFSTLPYFPPSGKNKNHFKSAAYSNILAFGGKRLPSSAAGILRTARPGIFRIAVDNYKVL